MEDAALKELPLKPALRFVVVYEERLLGYRTSSSEKSLEELSQAPVCFFSCLFDD